MQLSGAQETSSCLFIELPALERPQSLGESSAGKTESSKIVLQHLTFRGSNEGAVEGLDKKIIETNPILEPFGTRRPSATRTPRASASS